MPKKIQEVTETIVVGDTSALISLGVGNVLLKSLEISRILIPKKVDSELNEVSKFRDLHGKAAKDIIKLISKGKIQVGNVKQRKKISKLVSGYSRVNEGEAEALVLAQEKSIPILITDDFRSLPDLKKVAGKVEIHLSIYLLARLVLGKIITIKEAQVALNKISKGRTWESSAIYEYAMKYIEGLEE